MPEEPEATGESPDEKADFAKPLEVTFGEIKASRSDLPAEDFTKAPDRKKAKAREGLVLCLSGGGYRAALFHLGVLRRLNELGVLSQITRISSVSGGSIIAAHLAETVKPWPKFGESFPAWEEKVAQPFLNFTSSDIRTLPNLKMLLPWNFFKIGYNTKQLANEYLKITKMKIAELPENPTFCFCATDMTFGVKWDFERDYIGDYQAGYVPTPPDLPLAFAVAASSCFPPVFRPIPVSLAVDQFKGGGARKLKDYKELVESICLTDGGNYDNLGIESGWKKRSAYVLISDGSAGFIPESPKGLFQQLLRNIGISSIQADSVRKRWHLANLTNRAGGYKGTYLGINNIYKNDPSLLTYSKNLVEEVIARIRTDMDAFSTAERAVLENHGYLIAESQIQRKVPALAVIKAEVKVPHEAWMPKQKAGSLEPEEDHIREALADSHKRKIGRLKF